MGQKHPPNSSQRGFVEIQGLQRSQPTCRLTWRMTNVHQADIALMYEWQTHILYKRAESEPFSTTPGPSAVCAKRFWVVRQKRNGLTDIVFWFYGKDPRRKKHSSHTHDPSHFSLPFQHHAKLLAWNTSKTHRYIVRKSTLNHSCQFPTFKYQ